MTADAGTAPRGPSPALLYTMRTYSSFGNELMLFAAPALIYLYTRDLVLSGLAFTLQWIPQLVSLPLAGSFVDRFGSYRVYLWADVARVTVKNRRHAGSNPRAHLRDPITEDEVMATRMLSTPLRLGHLCPSSTGAAGVVLMSERAARERGLDAAWIRGIAQNTETFWMGDRVGPRADGDHADADALEVAFDRAYAQAGVTDAPSQVDVAEIYAPFAPVELHVIEAAKLCAKGESAPLMARGAFTHGSEGTVVNPSGGVLCSNPIAITGTVRVAEAALQVLGRAEDRQVPGADVAIASAIGGDHQFYSTAVLANHLEEIAA